MRFSVSFCMFVSCFFDALNAKPHCDMALDGVLMALDLEALFVDFCFSLQRGGQFKEKTIPQEVINIFHFCFSLESGGQFENTATPQGDPRNNTKRGRPPNPDNLALGVTRGSPKRNQKK